MDQNGRPDEEEGELAEKLCPNHHNCHKNFIRPSSSSSLRAPSWSRGFGAGSSEDADLDEAGDCCCCSCSDEQSGTRCCRCRSEQSRSASQDGDNCESQLEQCPTFHVDIPTVYLTRKDSTSSSTSSSFHVYQVDLKTSAGAQWSIYRRYSQFLALHQRLKACDQAVGKLSFPPKRRLNSKASTIVQERRRKLEIYMQKLCDLVIRRPAASADSVAEISPYKRLTSLATSGPAKLPRSSSRSGGNSLSEPGDGASLSDSTRSERVTGDNWAQDERVDGLEAAATDIERAVDVDELMSELGIEDEELERARSPVATSDVAVEVEAIDVESLRSVTPTTSVVDGGSGSSGSKNAGKSLRHLFYEFVSPQATGAEFELDHLGV